MEKLTNDQILFIENYLKNSGVEYLDIRLEMTDHVASEIEIPMFAGYFLEFYSFLREYMVSHKAELLCSLKKFKTVAIIKSLYRLLTISINPKRYCLLHCLQLV